MTTPGARVAEGARRLPGNPAPHPAPSPANNGGGTVRRSQYKHPWLAVALVAPIMVLVLVFRVIPVVDAIRLSLSEWSGIGSPQFVGISNYAQLFDDAAFFDALANNGLVLLTLPVWVLLPLLIAAVIREKVYGYRFFRSAIFLTAVLPPVVVGAYYGVLLRSDGPLVAALEAIGVSGASSGLLVTPSTALPATLAIVAWTQMGVGTMIYVSALAGVGEELFEAAKVDGASFFQTLRAVTVPSLIKTIQLWTVVCVIVSFTALFPLIYVLTAGGPGRSTFVIDFYIYREAFASGNLGYASAIGMVVFVLIALVSLAFIPLLRRSNEE